MTSERRRWLVPIAWAGSAALAAGLGFWAVGAATTAPQLPPPESESITTEVLTGTLAVEQAYGIAVDWPAAPQGVNGLTGTLTSISLPAEGRSVSAGEVLYTVDLAPVVAATGPVPAFRDLGAGAVGEDVRQLQQFLVDRGLLAVDPDGQYGAETARAVAEWSASLGLGRVDSVPLGGLVFLPQLPAQLAPAPDVRVGARVAAGDELLVGAEREPEFSFVVLPEAVARTVEGMLVRIDADGAEWTAQVDRLAADPEGTEATIARLAPVEGEASICGDACSSVLTLGSETVLAGRIELVPETTGSEVPTAAIRTDVDGAPTVVLDSGERVTVEILASANGRSIVTGVEPGQRVRITVPADEG